MTQKHTRANDLVRSDKVQIVTSISDIAMTSFVWWNINLSNPTAVLSTLRIITLSVYRLKLYIMPIQWIISTVSIIRFMILFSFKTHNKRASGASCRFSAKQAFEISSVCLLELQKEILGVYRSYSRFDLLLQGLECSYLVQRPKCVPYTD